jgi:prepilin-type N-terminal cleavage/methylation domain-containing protein
MPSDRPDPARPPARDDAARAFTLIEVLLVIVVISVISALGLAITQRVVNSNRERASENVLRTLDQLLETYVGQTGKLPPAIFSTTGAEVLDPAALALPANSGEADRPLHFPIIDGRYVGNAPGTPSRRFPIIAGETSNTAEFFDRRSDAPQPSTSLLLLHVRATLGNLGPLEALDARFLGSERLTAWGWRDADDSVYQYGFATGTGTAQVPLLAPVVRDAFGRAVRFVHPAFQGGFGTFYRLSGGTLSAFRNTAREHIDFADTSGPFAGLAESATGAARSGVFSRSARPFRGIGGGDTTARNPVGDADEGYSQGKQPYFYTTGPDGNPANREGNVYTNRPSFPPDTANLPID